MDSLVDNISCFTKGVNSGIKRSLEISSIGRKDVWQGWEASKPIEAITNHPIYEALKNLLWSSIILPKARGKFFVTKIYSKMAICRGRYYQTIPHSHSH